MNKQSTLFLLALLILLSTCQTDHSTDENTEISYQQMNRPKLHYSPAANWMGVPFSSIFFEEEFHLFYQYRSDNSENSPIHWGHAVSNDLTHWQQLEIAISADEQGEIQSGSVVVDWENTTGFSIDGEPPLVAIFTYNPPTGQQSQAIAYSTDQGRTWTKYDKNPVLTNSNTSSFHDPKVLWDGESQQWIMVASADDSVVFYGSKDLKDWKYLSNFGSKKGAHGGAWAYPDLFPTVIPETGNKKWVLLSSILDGASNGGSGTQYFIGEFDGKRFRLDQEFAPYLRQKNGVEKAVWLDYGRDHLASMSWSNIEDKNGRLLFISSMNNKEYASSLPTDTWQGSMTFPRVLELHSTANGPRIFQSFPDELNNLRKNEIPTNLSGVFNGTKEFEIETPLLEIILEAGVAQDSNTIIGFELSNDSGENYTLGFNAKESNYFSNRTKAGNNGFSSRFAENIHFAPKQIDGSLISMHIIIDATSCELIADDGLTVLSEQFFPSESFTKIEFFVSGMSADVQRFEVFELEGIWGDK